MARYPVTNAQWARFAAATGRESPQHWPGGVCPRDKATHPVVYVNWHDAEAYAEWTGLQLLSEAQWEKAARGGVQIANPQTPGELVDNPHPRRRYPWGDQFDRSKCNTHESGVGDTTPVGKSSPQLHPELVEGGDSPCGVADMAGNVWEWTRSLHKGYPYQAGDGREELKASGRRVFRGGSWGFRELSNAEARRDGRRGKGFRVFRVSVPPRSKGSSLVERGSAEGRRARKGRTLLLLVVHLISLWGKAWMKTCS